MSAVTDTAKPDREWLKRGRKTTYSTEKAASLCRYISLGYSLKKACGHDGMPSLTQVFEWKAKYPEFAAMYAKAQEERGMTFGDKIGDLCEQVLAGEVDPAAARVAIDGYKFTAARLASRTWGDKQEVSVTHGISQQAAEVLQALSQRARDRQTQPQMIDVTPQSVGPSVGLDISTTDDDKQ